MADIKLDYTDTLRIARDCGIEMVDYRGSVSTLHCTVGTLTEEDLHAMLEQARREEREACIALCDFGDDSPRTDFGDAYDKGIRACADAIRARNQDKEEL